MSGEQVKVYTIPLGDAWKASRPRRADAAIRLIKEFAKRHAKVEKVKISPLVSERVWQKGRQKPPRRIRVVFEKEDEDTVVVRLEEERK